MRAALCLIALLVPLTSCEPARASTIAAIAVQAATDSVRVDVSYDADPTMDSVVVRVTYQGATQQVKRTIPKATVGLLFAAPAEGVATSGTVAITTYKTGTASVVDNGTFSYTRPVLPLRRTIIDSIRVREVATALGVAEFIQRTTELSATGDTCVVEQWDYYGQQLLTLADSGPVTVGPDPCEAVALRLYGAMREAGAHHPRLMAYNMAAIRRAGDG